MPRLSALLVALALVASTFSFSSISSAADESPAVEALIQRGIQLRRTGDDEAALAVFLQAESEAPTSVRVLLHVVTAAQAAGKWLMAEEYMRRVNRDKEDPYYRRHRVSIEGVESAINQRVGQFQALGAPEGAEIRLNGEPFGKLPMAEPRSLETGTYVMEVVNAGYYNLRRPITVTGGVLTREAVELRVRPADAPVDFTASGAVRGGLAADAPPQKWWEKSWVSWTLGGVAVLGAGTATAALIVRERQADKWNDDDRCLDRDNALATREQVCGDVKDDVQLADKIAIIGGATAVAFGGTLLAQLIAKGISSGSPRGEAAGSKQAAPATKIGCSAGLMSVACQGSF
jgi:hypothetical protein